MDSCRALIFALLFMPVAAAGVDLDFNGVPVPFFARSVATMLDRDYVVDASVVSVSDGVTLKLRGVEPGQVVEHVRPVLGASGVQLDDDGKVLRFFRRSTPEAVLSPVGEKSLPDGSPVLYRCKNRPCAVLAPVARAFGTVSEESGEFLAVTLPSSKKPGFEAAMRQVDVPSPMVHVRAVLLDVTDSEGSGRSIHVLLSALSSKLSIFTAASAIANGVSIKAGGLQAVLRAVDGDSRFRYVAEPSIVLLDGELGTLTVGSDVPVRGQTTINASSTTTSVDYKTAGYELKVRPRVMDGGVVLDVQQQLSSVVATTTSEIDSPTINRRSISSKFRVTGSDVVMLAGLDQSTMTASTSGVFGVPLSKSSDSSRSQLVLLLSADVER